MAKKENKKWTHRVSGDNQPINIIVYAALSIPILGSKSAVKKAISSKRLYVNGKIAHFSTKVKKGDTIELYGAGIQEAKKFDIELETVYEDDHILVVNKPGGIAVNGNRQKTVENAVSMATRQNPQPDALPRPVAVHRIDVPTNGLVLLAKTKTALIELSKAFQDNQVKKEYVAVVHGKAPAKGRIDQAIDDKEAITNFETIRTVPSRIFKNLSQLRLKPITGRTHQLRIHLKNLGHFIVGDKLYAEDNKTILGKGLMLCACRLQFRHPANQKMITLAIDMPTKFQKLMDREEERFG